MLDSFIAASNYDQSLVTLLGLVQKVLQTVPIVGDALHFEQFDVIKVWFF